MYKFGKRCLCAAARPGGDGALAAGDCMQPADVISLDMPEECLGYAASSVRGVNGPQSVALRLNAFLICVALGGTLFQLFGMPFVLREFGIWGAFFLLPIMVLQPLHWGLLHEGIHARLLPNRRANEFCARVLSVTLGLPFDGTRFGHLVHHRFSRHSYDRPDVYDGRGPYALAWLAYRLRLFGGVYLSELLSPLIAFVPTRLGIRLMEKAIPIDEHGDAHVRRLYISLVLNVGKRRRTRRGFAMSLALYAASVWVYGSWWPMLLAAMYVRGLWHSFADNVPHHGVALDQPARARNYTLPLGFGMLVMNHHLHLTHHLYPRVPWTALGAVSLLERERPKGNYFRAALGQANLFFPAQP
jgi:fatty acid desaturase